MANIFTLENIDDFSEKLNIDELYEKKRNFDLSKLALFNKILNRIHVKIKTISRQYSLSLSIITEHTTKQETFFKKQ